MPSMGRITENFNTDYRYRARVLKTDLSAAMGQMVTNIGYSNFKNEVASVQGKDRSHVYGKVWSQLYQLQLEPDDFEWDSHSAIENMAIPAANSYGVVLISPDKKTLLRRVSGAFGGYLWTFAKGCPDGYETPQETAKRECLEEMGIHCRLVGLLPKTYQGTTGSTVFFIGIPKGDPEPFGPETTETRWVTKDEALKLLSMTAHAAGRERDAAILNDLYRWISDRQSYST